MHVKLINIIDLLLFFVKPFLNMQLYSTLHSNVITSTYFSDFPWECEVFFSILSEKVLLHYVINYYLLL